MFDPIFFKSSFDTIAIISLCIYIYYMHMKIEKIQKDFNNKLYYIYEYNNRNIYSNLLLNICIPVISAFEFEYVTPFLYTDMKFDIKLHKNNFYIYSFTFGNSNIEHEITPEIFDKFTYHNFFKYFRNINRVYLHVSDIPTNLNENFNQIIDIIQIIKLNTKCKIIYNGPKI